MKGFKKDGKFIPTGVRNQSPLSVSDAELWNSKNTAKRIAVWERENAQPRGKKSLNEVEGQCGLCDEVLIMSDDGNDHEGVEDCHQDCFENTYGAYDSHEDYITTEAKKRGISEKELQKIIDHEHGYDNEELMKRIDDQLTEFEEQELEERMKEINKNLEGKLEEQELRSNSS